MHERAHRKWLCCRKSEKLIFYFRAVVKRTLSDVDIVWSFTIALLYIFQNPPKHTRNVHFLHRFTVRWKRGGLRRWGVRSTVARLSQVSRLIICLWLKVIWIVRQSKTLYEVMLLSATHDVVKWKWNLQFFVAHNDNSIEFRIQPHERISNSRIKKCYPCVCSIERRLYRFWFFVC